MADLDAKSLAAAIEKSGYIAPLLVVLRSDGDYDLVAGLIRLLAAQELGRTAIHVIVVEGSPRELLETAFRDNEAGSRESVLDRARAIERLRAMRQAEGLPCRNADLAKVTHLDKGTVSSACKFAQLFPPDVEEVLERRHEAPSGLLRSLAREPLRLLARYPAHLDEMFAAAVRAAKKGTSPAKEMAAVVSAQMSASPRTSETMPPSGVTQRDVAWRMAYDEGRTFGRLEARSELLDLILRSPALAAVMDFGNSPPLNSRPPASSRSHRTTFVHLRAGIAGTLWGAARRLHRWVLSLATMASPPNDDPGRIVRRRVG